MWSRVRVTLMTLAGVLSVACADSSGGGNGGTPASELSFIRLAPTAPALCADSAGAWFVKGSQDKEIALEFPEAGSTCQGSTEDFLRLRIKQASLFKRPDGSVIPSGDSVFIYVKWVGNDSILFDLQPSGLQFNAAEPAELKIEYGEAGPDLNGDGNVDADDDLVEDKLDIWRQELPGDPFVRVGTAKFEDENEIEAKLNGFSRFALAY